MFIERVGLQRALIMGPNPPRPDWLPLVPEAVVVQAGHWLPGPGREIAGDIELLTHKGVEEIKRFYLERLRSVGFDTRDTGYGTLNAPAAAYLSIANVTTRSAVGLILPSRTVQIHWQKSHNSISAA